MMTEQALTKNEILSSLTKSAHGKLTDYCHIGHKAVKEDPEFYSHLMAWDFIHGQIRDTKVAFPMIHLASGEDTLEFVSNSLAHLALLSPRDLMRSLRFHKEMRLYDTNHFTTDGHPGHSKAIKRVISRYLRAREAKWGWWTKTVLQHRTSMKGLYAITHTKPLEAADSILFKGIYPKGTVLSTVSQLKDMAPSEAAGYILNQKIPFLVAQGAMGAKIKDPAVVLALINQMSPTELVTNTKMLERLGIKANPALRSAYAEATRKASSSKKTTFKATTAAAVLEDDNPLKEKLLGLQEKQIDAMGGIEGDWLLLIDKSGSMSTAIKVGLEVAAALARSIKGSVHLVFFDTSPRYIDATGKSYDALLKETQHITANGGTSIGVGLQYALERKLPVDAISIVSDAAENSYPQFAAVYEVASKMWGRQVPVYLYQVKGTDHYMHAAIFFENCKKVGLALEIRDLTAGVDYYSLPAIVQTMKVDRYSVLDEIMQTPLLDVDVILPRLG